MTTNTNMPILWFISLAWYINLILSYKHDFVVMGIFEGEIVDGEF